MDRIRKPGESRQPQRDLNTKENAAAVKGKSRRPKFCGNRLALKRLTLKRFVGRM